MKNSFFPDNIKYEILYLSMMVVMKPVAYGNQKGQYT